MKTAMTDIIMQIYVKTNMAEKHTFNAYRECLF